MNYKFCDDQDTNKYSIFVLIKRIKSYLISKRISKQIKALNILLKHLKITNSPVTVLVLANSDIPGLLCDAVNNHHPQIIRGVFACLLELSKNEEFYVQKHSTIVVETICRTLGILSKNVNTLKIVFCGLEIISKILLKSDKDTTINMAQVIALSRDLLFNNIYQNIHVNVIRVLRTILRIMEFFQGDLLATAYRALMVFGKLYKNNRKRFIRNITLVCDIIVCSLRHSSLEKHNNCSVKIMELIISLLQLSIVPFIQKLQLKKCHAGFINRLLYCVMTVCVALDSKRLKLLANSMASKEFLIVLPAVSLHFNEQSIHNCVVSILGHLVTSLANTYLRPCDTECQLIAAGMCSLPSDCSTWPQLLVQQGAHNTRCAIIVYLYFVVLCSDRFTKSKLYLPGLCSYIQVQTTTPSSAILKAVWLIFAVLTLSEADWSRQVQAATCVLVSWLRTTRNLDRVYTDHPALLLWAFSPLLTNKILQINLVIIWLKENKDSQQKELERLALTNRKVSICLLEVLSCCSQDLMPKLFPMLKTIMAQDKAQGLSDTSHFIWNNLPTTLAIITSPHPYPQFRVFNVCCLVSLACSVVPAQLKGSLLLRIALELLRTLRRHSSTPPGQILRAQLFKLANIIVIKSHDAEDYRVLELFLQNPVLLKALLACLDCEDKRGTLPALRLLTCLQYYHKTLNNSKLVNSRYVGGITLLQLMSRPRSEIMFATAHLFTVMLKSCSSTFSPLVTLLPSTPASILQALYLEFQNITLKTSNGWKCQRLLIEFCSIHNPQVEQHLLIQPWTYTIIHLSLQNNSLQDPHMSQFLRMWLQRCQLLQYSAHRRAIPRDRLGNTISQIAVALLHLESGDSIHSDIAVKICSFGAFIPSQTLRSLQEKLLYL